jgi:hypothetical protein
VHFAQLRDLFPTVFYEQKCEREMRTEHVLCNKPHIILFTYGYIVGRFKQMDFHST